MQPVTGCGTQLMCLFRVHIICIRKKVFLLFFLLFIHEIAKAQLPTKDDSVPLDTVTVVENRTTHWLGQRHTSLDSMLLRAVPTLNLTQGLGQQNLFFVRNYGPSMLASAGMRGTGAADVAVLWNGINIQSPLHGQVDLNNVVLFGQEHVNINYGGDGALVGNGSVGGSLELKPKIADSSFVSLGYGVGSFGLQQANAQVALVRNPYSIRLGLYGLDSKNAFKYMHPEQNQVLRMQHASYQMAGGNLDWVFQRKKKYVAFHAWSTFANRQIPPSIYAVSVDEVQRDHAHRILGVWRWQGKTSGFALKQAFFDESIRYYNLSIGNFANSALQSVSELTYSQDAGPIGSFSFVVLHQEMWADGDNLIGALRLSRPSLVLKHSIFFQDKKIQCNTAVRYQHSGKHSLPLVPSVAVEKLFFGGSVRLKGHYAVVYRLPTFNDWYWSGAMTSGNSSLQNEMGWNVGIAASFNKRLTKHWLLHTYVNPFFSSIRQKIQWILLPDGRLMPINIAHVQTNGVESGALLEFTPFRNIKFWSEARYDVSKPLIVASETREHVGNIPIYTPQEIGMVRLGMAHRSTSMDITWNYTGFRYTDQQNTAFLPSFDTWNMRISYLAHAYGRETLLTVMVQNILNEKYSILVGRPMPLRHALFQVQFKI